MSERTKRKSRRRAARAPGGLFAYFEAAEAPLGEAPAAQWRQMMRRRVFFVAVGLALWTVGVGARLFYLQSEQHGAYTARARKQQGATIKTWPPRGQIVDRDGHILAGHRDSHSIFAFPSEINDPERTARKLCEALDPCDEVFYGQLVNRLSSDRSFVYVRRRVSDDELARVEAFGLAGVRFEKVPDRWYPNGKLGAHLLGHVGIDNQGLAGLEFAYNSEVQGRPGQKIISRDAKGRVFETRLVESPTLGATLELTIDKFLQHIAERELHAAVEMHKADGGTVIILDPSSGEVLALANEPTFNPDSFLRDRFRVSPPDEENRLNRAIQNVYEPGSTFKIVTAAAALEKGVVRPDEMIDLKPCYIQFGEWRIDDASCHDTLSFADVIAKSSNVGTIKVAQKVGWETLGEYIERFGFGQKLLPDLTGESPGIVNDPSTWKDVDLATAAIGTSIAVTALQMAAATNVIANGGEFIAPRVVRALRHDGERDERPPHRPRRVVTRKTAETIRDFMEAAVRQGTGVRGDILGHSVAGKTGTARKLVGDGHSTSEYNASFVGFVPSRDPVFTILVLLDAPHGEEYYGGEVAAPIFRRIAESALRHRGVAPSNRPPSSFLARPIGGSFPGVSSPPRALFATFVTDDRAVQRMPDLFGLSARQARRELAPLEVAVSVQGNGVVFSQWPKPGVSVEPGMSVELNLARRLTTAESDGLRP